MKLGKITQEYFKSSHATRIAYELKQPDLIRYITTVHQLNRFYHLAEVLK